MIVSYVCINFMDVDTVYKLSTYPVHVRVYMYSMYMYMYIYWYIFAFHCTDVESTHLVDTEHQ